MVLIKPRRCQCLAGKMRPKEDGILGGLNHWGGGAPGNFQVVGGGTLEARLPTFPEFQHHLDLRS